MERRKYILLVVLLIALALSACSAQPTQSPPTAAPTTVVEPGVTQPAIDLPQTDVDVPRVSVEEAKASFDSGLAIIVDVRHPNDFEESHVAGAISVPLIQIESDLSSLTLNKEQWIITYCT